MYPRLDNFALYIKLKVNKDDIITVIVWSDLLLELKKRAQNDLKRFRYQTSYQFVQ